MLMRSPGAFPLNGMPLRQDKLRAVTAPCLASNARPRIGAS